MPEPSPRERWVRRALPVAIAAALLVQLELRSVPERHGHHLATTAVPANWSALPVTAIVTGAAGTKDDRIAAELSLRIAMPRAARACPNQAGSVCWAFDEKETALIPGS